MKVISQFLSSTITAAAHGFYAGAAFAAFVGSGHFILNLIF